MSESRSRWVLRVVVVLLGAAVYANALTGPFVYDDRPNIVERADVLAGPVRAALAHDRRPVVTMTLMLNHELGGLHPVGYHAFNIVVHLVAALLLFELVAGVLRLPGANALATPAAFTVATLWMLHPLQTESVTYVIQRAESLAGMCLFIVLLALLRLRQGAPARRWAAVAVGACLLGMGSKATMIAAPLVAILFDGLILSASFGAALRARWGLHASLAMTCAILVATGVVGGIVAPPEGVRAGAGFGVPTVSSAEYLRSQPCVILHYLRLAVWPLPQCIDWDWAIETRPGAIVVSGAVVLALGAATAWAVWRRCAFAFPAAAFFVWLLPTSSFVPLRDLAVEHRMYVPLAALVAIVVGVGARLARDRPRRIAGTAIALVLMAALAAATVARNRAYANPIALWTATLEVVPENTRARMNLGVALHDAGRTEEALDHLAAAVAAEPANATAHYNYGVALLRAGFPELAINPLGLAAGALRHADADRALGTALRRTGRAAEALRLFERAHADDPSAASALVLAALLEDMGDADQAWQWRQRAAALDAEERNRP